MGCVKLTDKHVENIVVLREKGVDVSMIAEMLGYSQSAISHVLAADAAAAARDFQALQEVSNYSENLFRIVCARHGVTISESVESQQPDNAARAMVSILESLHEIAEGIRQNGKAMEALMADISQMRMTLASFRGEIPGHVAKIVETINVNADIATKEHQKMADLLTGIKINTKRRANQD